MPDIEPAAPAQPESPTPPPSAVDQAVINNDPSAYRAARLAERSGKPLAPAPVEPAAKKDDPPAPAQTEEARQVSKRQQQINDYERRIAEQNERIARLEQQLKPADVKPEPPKADTPDFSYPEFPEWAAKPGNETKSYETYIESRALARWRFEQQQEQTKQQTAEQETQAKADHAKRAESWGQKVRAARTKHADFDEVALMAPTEIQRGSVIDQWIQGSEEGAEILYHLQQHPEEIRRIHALPSEVAQVRELVKLEESLKPAPVKPVTEAPAPPQTLGSKATDAGDPVDAAVRAGDMGAYRRARLAERAATLR